MARAAWARPPWPRPSRSRAAGARQRTLVVSTDPAHSLGDALGHRLGARVTRVPAGGTTLDAVELDADRALARWLRGRRGPLRLIAERGTYLDDADLDRFLGLSFPGVDELGGLLELTRVAEAGRYDTVVVDTAPTGHTLRLLAVPEVLRRIAAVLGEMLAKHHFLLTRLSGRDRRDAADRLVAEIDAEAGRLAGLLRDRHRVRFRWIVLPETLAVEEARDAVQQLEQSGIAIDEILVNRVTAMTDPGRPFDRRRAIAEREAVRAVRRAFPGRPVRLVPELAEEPRGPRGAPSDRRRSREAPRGAAGPPRHGAGRAGGPPAPRISSLARSSWTGRRWSRRPASVSSSSSARAASARRPAPPRPRWRSATRRRPAASCCCPPIPPTRSVTSSPRASATRSGACRPDRPPSPCARSTPTASSPFGATRYRAAVDKLFDAIRGDSRFDVAFDRAVVRDLVDLAPGGLDELCGLLTVMETLFPPGAAAPRHDLVVVDTAPTGHTLRLLALPGLALQWVRALLTTVLKYRQVLGLGSLGADLVELSRGLRQLQALLADPRQARVVVVSRAAALPRLETIRLLRRLDTLGLTVSALIVNALRPAGTSRAGATGAEAAEVRRLRAAARRGRRGLTGVPVLLAPAVAPPPTGVTALRGWACTWTRAAS